MVGQFSLFAVLAMALVAEVANALMPATHGTFPHQVSLRVHGRHTCGGAIVGSRHIVTTAKCVMDLPTMGDLLVITGSLSSSTGGESYSPRKIVIHPDFKRGTTGPNDIAIIALKTVIDLTTNQRPLYLSRRHARIDSDAILTGWRWAPIGDRSDMEYLMKLTVTIKKCSEPTVDDLKEFCASVGYGSGDCLPDKGGPLVSDGTLIGLLSYGNTCDAGTSAVFTNVVYHSKWIYRTIRET